VAAKVYDIGELRREGKKTSEELLKEQQLMKRLDETALEIAKQALTLAVTNLEHKNEIQKLTLINNGTLRTIQLEEKTQQDFLKHLEQLIAAHKANDYKNGDKLHPTIESNIKLLMQQERYILRIREILDRKDDRQIPELIKVIQQLLCEIASEQYLANEELRMVA
jgi:hypothetical protein